MYISRSLYCKFLIGLIFNKFSSLDLFHLSKYFSFESVNLDTYYSYSIVITVYCVYLPHLIIIINLIVIPYLLKSSFSELKKLTSWSNLVFVCVCIFLYFSRLQICLNDYFYINLFFLKMKTFLLFAFFAEKKTGKLLWDIPWCFSSQGKVFWWILWSLPLILRSTHHP